MGVVIRRLEFFAITLWATLTLNFLLPRLIPGNPAQSLMARYHGRLNPAALHALQVAFGLTKHESLLQQYFDYLGDVARGRFGLSLTYFPDSVNHVVMQALPWTLGLAGAFSVAFGVLVALYPRSGALAIIWIIGLYAILDGILRLYLAYRLNDARKGVRSRLQPSSGRS